MGKVIMIGAQKYVLKGGEKIPVEESLSKRKEIKSGLLSGMAISGDIRAFGGTSKPLGWNAPPANKVAKKRIEPSGEKKAGVVIREEENPEKKGENIREGTVKAGKSAEVAVEKEHAEGKIPSEGAGTGVETHPEAEKQTGAETQAGGDKPKRGRGRRGRRRKQTAEDGMLI